MKKISLVLSIVMILNIVFSSIVLGATEATITAEIDGTRMSSNKCYTMSKYETITIIAKHSSGIEKVVYAFDNDSREYTFVSDGDNTVEFVPVVPAKYKDGYEHTLLVYALTSEGKYNEEWAQFHFKVKNNENTVLVPNIQIETNGKYMNEFTTIEMNSDDKIYFNITSSNGIDKIIYAFDNDSTEYTKSTGIFSIDVPSKYKDGNEHTLLVQVQDEEGSYSIWYTYKFIVIDEYEEPTVILKNNNVELTKGKLYTLKDSDVLNVTAKHPKGINVIVYAFDNDAKEYNIYNQTGRIDIPEKYKDGNQHSLLILAESNNGTYIGWLEYKFKFEVETEEFAKPIITGKTNTTTMKQDTTYIVNLNQVIKIQASCIDGIKNITYKIDNGNSNTFSGDVLEIIAENMYNDNEEHEIIITATSNNGIVSDTYKYYFKIKQQQEQQKPDEPQKPTNTKYEVIMQPDENINNNVSKLAVSLRNISNLNGNKNRYAVSEYAYYNIDFVNAGSAITGNVTLTFNIPENATVKFIDTKGGQINGKTVTWTFYGMQSGECGTIPVILQYTSITGDYMTVKPIATIFSGSLKDVSAVQNIVYKTNTSLDVNHEPYMYGDAKVDTFRPNDGINRAEMAAVITRVFKLNKVQSYTVTYKDADVIAHDLYRWSTQDIMTVTKYGLMEGYEDGTFRPGEKVTKAEFITVLARIFENNNSTGFEIKNAPIKLFGNKASHWAAPYMAQLMRLNMIGDALGTNENPDNIITRAEVAHLMNGVMFRGPANTNITENFSDVNSSTPYYTDILEATTDIHDAKFNTNGMETVIK